MPPTPETSSQPGNWCKVTKKTRIETSSQPGNRRTVTKKGEESGDARTEKVISFTQCKWGDKCINNQKGKCIFNHSKASGAKASYHPKVAVEQEKCKVSEALAELIEDPSVNINSLFDSSINCSKLTYILMGLEKSPGKKPLYRIPSYNNYCSDHGIISLEGATRVTVSFNVEHNGHVHEKCQKFLSGIEADPEVSRTFDTNKKEKFISKILQMKNERIVCKIQEIITMYERKEIVINLQEVTPSLYVILAKKLKCRVTKLISQHQIEINQDYDAEKLVELGVKNAERTEENIAAIEKYKRELEEKVPTYSDLEKYKGRFEVNGSFMSMVYTPSSSVDDEKDTSIEIDIDMENLPASEKEYADKVMASNSLLSNECKFVRARPIMLYSQICNIGSRMLDNGVMFGSFFVICRGIYLEDYKTINFHGHKKSKSSEHLLEGIVKGNLNTILDVFDYDFDSEREYKVADKRVLIETEIFEPILTKFIEGVSEVSKVDVDYVVGDFNMRDDEFNKYGLKDEGIEPLNFKRGNTLDRIISTSIRSENHTARIHIKKIV
jgi:hypothetical protein